MIHLKRMLLLALTAMLLGGSACAMTVQEARDAVLANDPRAADAREFWMYQPGESSGVDGMWVVYATGKSAMPMEGGAWFVTLERAVSLGPTRNLIDWEFFSSAPQPPVPDWAEKVDAALWPAAAIAGGPELMVSRTDRLNAWQLDAAGLPRSVDTGRLLSIEAECGQLLGIVQAQDCDYAFLAQEEGKLLQIAGVPVEASLVRGLPDGAQLLDQLAEQGYALTGLLYRPAVPGGVERLVDVPNAAGSFAVNLEKDGQAWHTYFYYPQPGQALAYIDGSAWGDEETLWIATFDGAASPRLDVGLETLETEIQ